MICSKFGSHTRHYGKTCSKRSELLFAWNSINYIQSTTTADKRPNSTPTTADNTHTEMASSAGGTNPVTSTSAATVTSSSPTKTPIASAIVQPLERGGEEQTQEKARSGDKRKRESEKQRQEKKTKIEKDSK